jgi:hypothetical protein
MVCGGELRAERSERCWWNLPLRGPSTAPIAKCAIGFAQDDNLWAWLEELLDGVEGLAAVDGFGQDAVD